MSRNSANRTYISFHQGLRLLAQKAKLAFDNTAFRQWLIQEMRGIDTIPSATTYDWIVKGSTPQLNSPYHEALVGVFRKHLPKEILVDIMLQHEALEARAALRRLYLIFEKLRKGTPEMRDVFRAVVDPKDLNIVDQLIQLLLREDSFETLQGMFDIKTYGGFRNVKTTLPTKKREVSSNG